MLQFIVLGLIPGTHFQITYLWMLVLLDIAVSLIIVILAYEFLWLRPQFLQHLEEQAKSKSKKSRLLTR